MKSMKVMKFPQSCLLVESEGHKIIIDPGVHFLQSHHLNELKGVEAVLYTHQHSDHYDEDIASALLEQGVHMYANDATADLIGTEKVTVVHDGDNLMVAGFEVIARELPHCLLPDGSEGPQNTGYVINGVLFHPGDGKELDDLKVDNLALPITGPDISILDAVNFAKQVGAKVAIPIHYDGIPADPNVFAAYAGKGSASFEVRVLADGESTEL
jgi:L-ascorbate metabolism protein UlaG (beta-lactamase superfamily)